MNIFATYDCPVKSALVLDDLRLNKMIVESAQMLSAVMHKNNIKGNWYKPAYLKHPCTIWAGISKENYLWLCTHALAMCMIFEETNKKIHGSERILLRLKEMSSRLQSSQLTPFEDCTTFKLRTDLSVTERYKLYLVEKWEDDLRVKRIPTWRCRKIPEFYNP